MHDKKLAPSPLGNDQEGKKCKTFAAEHYYTSLHHTQDMMTYLCLDKIPLGDMECLETQELEHICR